MNEKNFDRKVNGRLAIAFLAVFAFAVAVFLVFEITDLGRQIPIQNVADYLTPHNGDNGIFDNKDVNVTAAGIRRFESEDDFKSFLLAVRGRGASSYGSWGIDTGIAKSTAFDEAAGTAASQNGLAPTAATRESAPDRVSETNVQVAGIDEPDIVKTDGKQLYYSPNSGYWPIMYEKRVSPATGIFVPPYDEPSGTTYNVAAWPPTALKTAGTIAKQGDLLLHGNTLLIFSTNTIYGYDVASAASPKEIWKIRLEDTGSLVGARLFNDRVYLVVRNGIDDYNPCPVKPLSFGDAPMVVQCRDIYYPESTSSADAIFSALVVNPETGGTEKSLSFVGSASQSILYMSPEAIYLTWRYAGDYTAFYFDFLQEKGKDLVPDSLIEKIGRLSGYDISDTAKLTEISVLLQNYRAALDADARTRFENEMTNRMSDYAKAHSRELEKTGVTKIALPTFGISATGSIPGTPLNQFALDEYNGYLRVATTVGGTWGMFGRMGETANDIYVLNANMSVVGSLTGLGLDERIYSARFVKDRGYLVTFKQTDPFFVLDLSDPSKPEMKGELKIPGYSSYLHPVSDNLILGIGSENWQVKLSLFDVSIAAKPAEVSKYILAENWTEAQNNHHAFLLDAKNQLFFLPGSKGGYIFSYAGNTLALSKVVSGVDADRAVYINNLLYVVAADKITVLDEKTFQKVAELDL